MKYFILILFFSKNVYCTQWEQMLQKIVNLRAEVELISKENASLLKEKQSEIEALNQRKIEMNLELDKEEFKKNQMDEKLKSIRASLERSGKIDITDALKLKSYLLDFDSWLKTSVPFKLEERTSTIKNLISRIETKNESLDTILQDLILFIEKEYKLSNSSEYKVEEIQNNNKKTKAEIARIGLKSLFAITPEKRVLYQKKSISGEWEWEYIENPNVKVSIENLISDLKSKKMNGLYNLPLDSNIMGASL